jgi:hypothetical protein
LEFLIKSTVCETYVLNCNGNVIGGVNKNFLLNTCGIIKRLIRDCGPPIELRAGQDPDPDSYAQRERIRNRIQVLTNTLNLNVLERIDLQCEPDIFMETLLNNLKNDVISHQIFMRKVKKMKIKQLTDTLLMLKKNYTGNALRIKEIENELHMLLDLEMRAELEKFKHYDILHNEKMTPRFLTLTKIKSKKNLDCIKQDNGDEFRSSVERDSFIRDFYRKIYTPPQGMTELRETVVEDFLGPEICNNRVLIDSKLTNDDSQFFERPLSIQELDTAAQSLNEKSAGGLDGISSKFIKKFWAYLRVPLNNYAAYCFERGTLT